MSIKDAAKNSPIYEVEYKEVHTDEMGNNYYKNPVSQAPLLTKIFPITLAVIFILLIILTIKVSALVSLVIMLAIVLVLKPLKNKVLIPYLLKTDKYYDDTKYEV